MTTLADPSVDKDSNVFASHRKNGFSESGRRDEHSAPLVRLALLLGRLDGQRQLLVKNLDEQLLAYAELQHPEDQVGLLAHNFGMPRGDGVSRMRIKVKRVWAPNGLLSSARCGYGASRRFAGV